MWRERLADLVKRDLELERRSWPPWEYTLPIGPLSLELIASFTNRVNDRPIAGLDHGKILVAGFSKTQLPDGTVAHEMTVSVNDRNWNLYRGDDGLWRYGVDAIGQPVYSYANLLEIPG